MRGLSTVAVCLSILLFAGCAGQKELVERQQDEIRALRAEIELLKADLEAARRGGDAELRARIADLERELALALTREQELRNSARGTTIEILQADIFFESGSADLTDEGKKRLSTVAEKMKREYPNRTFRIEGFTDSNPIGPRLRGTFPDNWALSAARAAAVVRHLHWQQKMGPESFEIVGFGEYHPIADNSSADGRRQNRRVRIAVMP